MYKNYFISFVLLASLLLFSNCSKENNDGNNNNNPPQTTGANWGEFIDIPGISPGVAGDGALYLKTSNEGLYMQVTKGSNSSNWIYRMQIAGIPRWTTHEQPQLYFDWDPTNETSESADDFSIFFSTIDKNGYVNINTGLPALMEENHPSGFSAQNEMLVDNSSGAYKWAFFGSVVKIQDNTNLGLYNPICTLPAGGILFAEADPYDAIVWAAAGSTIYKITVNGAITTFDVGSYNDPNIITSTISKIRFPYDPTHKDVYFKYQNKVFKITNGNSLSLFYTINNSENLFGGDFCVDNTYLYANDGNKINLGLPTIITNIIPPAPSPLNTDQNTLMQYYLKSGGFKSGTIEVSKNPLDNYIYTIYNSRILRVPKSL